MRKPNLFILGAPKCGTTSIAYYLNQHPEIFVSPYKEPHYFNLDSEYRFTFSEKQYLENFKNATVSIHPSSKGMRNNSRADLRICGSLFLIRECAMVHKY